jgi:hypothetical protein
MAHWSTLASRRGRPLFIATVLCDTMHLAMSRSIHLLRAGVDGVLVAGMSSDEEAAAAVLMIKDTMPDHLVGLRTRSKGIADALDLATAAWADALWWDGDLVEPGGTRMTDSGRLLCKRAIFASDLTCLFRAHPSWAVLPEFRRTGSLIPVFQDLAGALGTHSPGSATGLMISSPSNWAVLDHRSAAHLGSAVFVADAALDAASLTYIAGRLQQADRQVPALGTT